MVDLPTHFTVPEGVPAEEVRALATCLASMVAGQAAGTSPVIAPTLLLGTDALKPYAARMLPTDGMGMVHESQSFLRGTDLSLGGPLAVSASLTEKGPARVFDFALEDQDRTELGTMQTRLREVTPEEMTKFKGSQFPPHMDKGDVVWRDSRAFAAKVVQEYLALARDPNPIHTSGDAARRIGLTGPVVPGMFFTGVIEYVLASVLPAVTLVQMKLRFMAPVAVGEGLRYGVLSRGVDDEGHANSARVFVLRSDSVIAAIADLEMRPKDQAT